VRVRVVRVNLEQAKIDFVLAETKQPQSMGPKEEKKKPRDIEKKMKKVEKWK
jgi:hypothetical protein